MFSYSDFETDVSTMIAYASQPTDPAFIAQPSNTDLEQGVAPLETLPAQWWNWLMNQFTTKFNYVRTYVDNIMKEITGVLTLVDLSADDTDSQLSNVFANLYPNYLSEFVHTIATSYVETTGHTYAVAVYDNDGNGDYKTTKASALPVLVGGTGANTDQGGLENLCASIPAAVSSQSTDEVMFKDGTNVKKVTLADMAPQIYQLIKNNIEADSLYTRFQMPFVSSEAIGTAKTVDFPDGYTPSTDPDHAKLVFKVLFLNGHNTLGTLDYMTLNGLPIVVYQNGTLVNIPIHTMDDNGTTVYKVLDPNVMLDLYYTADWDGNGTAGWIVAGNPEVLKSTDYTIYADGYNAIEQYSTSEVKTNKYWIDGKPIYRKCFYSATGYTYNQVVGTIDNVERVVEIIGNVVNNANKSVYCDYNDSVNEAFFIVNTVNGNVIARFQGDFLGSNPQSCIVEYTKTTD